MSLHTSSKMPDSETADGGAALRVEGIWVRRGERDLLSDVSWRVERGERWVVLGPNGAGKSTLLKVLTGEMFPTQGVVEVLGSKLGHVDVRELRKRMGFTGAFVNEAFRAEIPAVEVVMSGKHAARETWWHRYSSSDRERAEGLLALLGCGSLATAPFGNCSSGERQRILLARTLMSDPELLILDEPTAGLDLQGREDLLVSLTQLDPTLTMLLVTHHVEEIPPTATHILLLNNGRVTAQGPIAQTLTQPNLQTCYNTPLNLEHRQNRYWSWREG